MPPRMKRRPRSKIHDSGKGATRQILNFARAARDDPDSLIPDCAGECARCPREALIQRLRKLSSMAGNKSGLEWASRWGGDLERAYASLVLIAGEEDIMAVANLNLGGKVVSYAVRGHPPALAVAGLQNWDDPEVRLLAYRKTAGKLGISLYSTDDSLLCTGTESRPPKAYLDEVAKVAGYGGLSCGHKAPSPVKLRIAFPGDLSFEACEGCAAESTSFVSAYMSRSCEKRPLSSASFNFVLEPECDGKCGDCPSEVSTQLEPKQLKPYLARNLSDRKLLSSARAALLRLLEPGTVVAGGRCFGKGSARIVAELAADDLERLALETALTEQGSPVLVDSMTVNKLLNAVWGDRGEAVLRAVAGEEAAKLYDPADEQPMNTLRQAAARAKRASMNAALPRYKALGPVGTLADETARAYKESGQAGACDHLDRLKTLGHRENSVALAFYIAMEQEANRMWKYSKEESDLGASLAPMAKDMLESSGGAYDRALRHLLKMSGSSEEPA
ncbi:MAG: hypothetical protein V1934_08630 [Methanobacteriota archaeon]